MRHSKRVLDIAPPDQEEASPQSSPEGEKRKKPAGKVPGKGSGMFGKIKWVALILLIGGAGVFGVHLFFAKAQIEVWPESRQVQLDETIIVTTDAEAAENSHRTIVGEPQEQTLRATRLFTTTGTESDSQRAEGTIRVFNERSSSLTLVAETRFISEDGQLFRAPEAITIPGASRQGGELVPGSTNVRVVAAEPGPEYNIGSSNFSLPGLAGTELYTLVYGKSSEPTEGGTKNEVAVVSQEDIDRAKEQLISDLTTEAERQMQDKLNGGMIVKKEAMEVEVIEASTPINPGAELEEFNYTAEIRAGTLAFRERDVKELAREFLRTRLREREQLDEERVSITYDVGSLDREAETLRLQVTAQAPAYEQVDTDQLASKVAGAKRGSAEKILEAEEGVERASVSFWPFWVRTVPGDSSRIDITPRMEPVPEG